MPGCFLCLAHPQVSHSQVSLRVLMWSLGATEDTEAQRRHVWGCRVGLSTHTTFTDETSPVVSENSFHSEWIMPKWHFIQRTRKDTTKEYLNREPTMCQTHCISSLVYFAFSLSSFSQESLLSVPQKCRGIWGSQGGPFLQLEHPFLFCVAWRTPQPSGLR